MRVLYLIIFFQFTQFIFAQPNKEKISLLFHFQSGNISAADFKIEDNTFDNIGQISSGNYQYILLDRNGAELYSNYFNPPEYIYYDNFENGIQSGGKIENKNFYFNIEFPALSGIEKIIIKKHDSLVFNESLSSLSSKKQLFKNQLDMVHPYTILQNSGNSKNRINLVFLGDGYTNINESFIDANHNGKRDGDDYVDLNQNGKFDSNEPYWDNNKNYRYDSSEVFTDTNADGIFNYNEQQRYDKDVNEMVGYLFGSSIFGKYRNHFNVYRIDNIFSEQTGADHEYNTPTLRRNTALNSYYSKSTERLLITDYSIVNNIIRSSISELGSRYIVIVLVNCPKYGGSGGSISVSYNGTSGYEVMVHELGHTLPGLADEYDYPGDPTYSQYSGAEPYEPNSTIKILRNEIKWKNWIKPSTLIPTTYSNEIGLFEGSRYYVKGIYRPAYNCKMRALNTPFCSVCNNAIIRTMYLNNNVVDSYFPISDTVTISSLPYNFKVNTIESSPNSLSYKWILNNNDLDVTGKEISLNTIPAGKNILSVTVADTSYLNKIDTLNYRKSKSWTIYNNSTNSTGIINILPKELVLNQNYPNPFNPTTSISYYLPQKTIVSVKIFNILGEIIQQLADGEQQSGYHNLIWNAGNFPSGVYYYQITTPFQIQTKRMILAK